MVLSATLTQDPGRIIQLNLHHPLLLKAGQMRYRFPENLESYKLVWHCMGLLSRLIFINIVARLLSMSFTSIRYSLQSQSQAKKSAIFS
jgi:ATP-dependent RNA helicase DDX51/DBP6